MAQIQVRKCPDDLYEAVALSAEMDQRSIAQETIYFLRRVIDSEEEKSRRHAYACKKNAGLKNVTTSEILTMSQEQIEEGRIRRKAALKFMRENPITLADDFPTPREILEEDRQ